MTTNSGTDGWVSSKYHWESETAQSATELQRVYAQWAQDYDNEMQANDLKSYKSIGRVVVELLNRNEVYTEQGLNVGSNQSRHINILDAGCGTGLLGTHLRFKTNDGSISKRFQIIGIDISCEMLKVAKEKLTYNSLLVADIHRPCLLPHGFFDFVVAAGLFMPGHCGPSAIQRLADQLTPGGYLVFTVRESDFAQRQNEYEEAINLSRCFIEHKSLEPYYGPIYAYVITARKT